MTRRKPRSPLAGATRADRAFLRAAVVAVRKWERSIGTAKQTLPPELHDLPSVTSFARWEREVLDRLTGRASDRAYFKLDRDAFDAATARHHELWEQRYRPAEARRKADVALRVEVAALRREVAQLRSIVEGPR